MALSYSLAIHLLLWTFGSFSVWNLISFFVIPPAVDDEFLGAVVRVPPKEQGMINPVLDDSGSYDVLLIRVRSLREVMKVRYYSLPGVVSLDLIEPMVADSSVHVNVLRPHGVLSGLRSVSGQVPGAERKHFFFKLKESDWLLVASVL